MKINANSWHYKVAQFGDLDDYEGQTDLCRYFWAMVRGFLKAPFFIFLGAVAGILFLVIPLAALAGWIATGILVFDIGFVILGFEIFLAIVAASMVFTETTQTGAAVRAGYRGWKEKTCVLIEVESA